MFPVLAAARVRLAATDAASTAMLWVSLTVTLLVLDRAQAGDQIAALLQLPDESEERVVTSLAIAVKVVLMDEFEVTEARTDSEPAVQPRVQLVDARPETVVAVGGDTD